MGRGESPCSFGELRHLRDAVVRGEREDDRRRVAQLVQRVDQHAHGAIDAEDLVVQLARRHSEAVPHGVGRRERDREEIRRAAGAESHGVHAGEGELDGDVVHPREGEQVARGRGGIGGHDVRERRLSAAVLEDHGVRLGIRREREERRPRFAGVALRDAQSVERVHPVGELVAVVAARREASVALVPEHRLARAADRQNGTAVFSRDRESARARVTVLEPVEERRSAKANRRRPGPAAADDRRARIRHSLRVEHDPGSIRLAAGEKRGVARRRLGVRVVLECVGENSAVLVQASEAAGELARPLVEIVGAHLVDRDQDDQSWRRTRLNRRHARLRGARGRNGAGEGEEGEGGSQDGREDFIEREDGEETKRPNSETTECRDCRNPKLPNAETAELRRDAERGHTARASSRADSRPARAGLMSDIRRQSSDFEPKIGASLPRQTAEWPRSHAV